MYLDHYTNDIPEAAMQAAEKGLAWLKESGPVYGLDVNQVDIGKLDLSHYCQCVLGQLGGDYADVVNDLIDKGIVPRGDATREAFRTGTSWTQVHGFQCGPMDFKTGEIQGNTFGALDAAWTKLLLADRAEGKVA